MCKTEFPFGVSMIHNTEWMCSSAASQATQCIHMLWLIFTIGVKDVRDQGPCVKQEGVSHSVINSWEPSCKSISHSPFESFHLVRSSKGLDTCVRQSHIKYPGHTLCGKYPSVSFLAFFCCFHMCFTVSVSVFFSFCLSLPPWHNNKLVSHFLFRREWWTGGLTRNP